MGRVIHPPDFSQCQLSQPLNALYAVFLPFWLSLLADFFPLFSGKLVGFRVTTLWY
jgi:hypothetical protein